ncbi:MAG TPA: GGDEF domain-containing protein [Terracidiphilus sp.]
MSSVAQQAAALRPVDRLPSGKLPRVLMAGIFAAHLVVLLVDRHAAGVSRIFTSALVAVAGLCTFWRARLLPWRERPTWLWAGTGVLLWAAAHSIEVFAGHSTGGSVLTVDASDFVYVCAIFPLLMAFATTRETQSLRGVFVLNCAQTGLALVLAWYMLYRMSRSPEVAEVIMGRIYGAACALLAVMSLMRRFCRVTEEERQALRWISFFLWSYLPVELGMDYLTQYRGLTSGTLLDLAWSIPFGIAGWFALALPLSGTSTRPRAAMSTARLLVECACPLLLNAGIFALAAAVIRQHLRLGLIAIGCLLLIQGLQAALVQMSYLNGRRTLLARESELRAANASLEQLALVDPLTGIANRRRFDHAFRAAFRRASRRRHPLALLLVDADFFKSVNDLHGHPYGDECLVALAGVMACQARGPDDVVARIGGEEFVVLLPDTDADGAAAVARRLHEEVQKLALLNEASPFGGRLTISIGLAAWFSSSGLSESDLMRAADQTLYRAKQGGRNRTASVLLESAEVRPSIG